MLSGFVFCYVLAFLCRFSVDFLTYQESLTKPSNWLRFDQPPQKELDYLWKSGDWKLHSTYQPSAKVVFVFEDGRPTLRELLSVRSLLPRFRDSPITLLKDEVGSVAEYVAGDFGSIEARSLDESAQDLGLKTRMEDTSTTLYLAVCNDDTALVIRDQELSKLVHAEMKRHGVPVVSMIEAD